MSKSKKPAPNSESFPVIDPAAINDKDVARLDFGALMSLALEAVDAMDEGLTKSGALADARANLNKARELVEGVQSGRIF